LLYVIDGKQLLSQNGIPQQNPWTDISKKTGEIVVASAGLMEAKGNFYKTFT
jgi:hypothetical protein